MNQPPQSSGDTAQGPWEQSAGWTFRLLFFLVIAIAVGWLFSGIHRVPADSQAVVFRFGKVVDIQGAGLLLAWPAPIDRVHILPAASRQTQFAVTRLDRNAGRPPVKPASDDDDSVQAYVANSSLSGDPRQNTAFFLTGDSNIVRLQATLFYQITDPVAYVIADRHIAPALQRLFIASAVSVMASRDLDGILVARPERASRPTEVALRDRLRGDLVDTVNARLQSLSQARDGLGIQISRVDLVASIPDRAKEAFDHVLAVTQDVQKNIAQARTQAELKTQQTNQQRAEVLADATARAQEQVTRAQAQTATIVALAGQTDSAASRQVLMNRLYYERVGALLKKAGHVQTVDGDGPPVILPGTSTP